MKSKQLSDYINFTEYDRWCYWKQPSFPNTNVTEFFLSAVDPVAH